MNTIWGGTLLSRRVGTGLAAASTFYTFDPQGNVAQRLDASANVLGAYAFDAYGLRTGTDGTTDPYAGFGGGWGYYADAETGLSLLGHRYYDTGTGRFLTRDLIGYEGGINLYAYTENNPTMGADPSGFDPYAQGQKFLVHGQKGNYLIDVPMGQHINRNVSDAVQFLDEGSYSDLDLLNLNGLPHSRRANYLGSQTANYTCGDYKDKPEYIDKNKNYGLWHERDLGGNFNLGAMGNALGFHLWYLLLAGDVLHRQNTKWTEPHPADEQQAIIDGFNWYSKHHGR